MEKVTGQQNIKGNKNRIGENLVRIRKMRGISQQELSQMLAEVGCNISMTGISRIEQGNRRAYDFEVFYLCKVLQVSMEELYFG